MYWIIYFVICTILMILCIQDHYSKHQYLDLWELLSILAVSYVPGLNLILIWVISTKLIKDYKLKKAIKKAK